MTTNEVADPANAGKLAQEIVAVLAKADSATRHRAVQAAMMLLGDSFPSLPNSQSETTRDESADRGTFFNRGDDLKPADNAYLCAAYHFSNFGAVSFSIAEIRSIAADAGLIIPDRLDMTFSSAAKKGKKLFQSVGRGLFKPTAAGALEFKERWEVKPGRQVRQAPS
jgi:hypothetical protein